MRPSRLRVALRVCLWGALLTAAIWQSLRLSHALPLVVLPLAWAWWRHCADPEPVRLRLEGPSVRAAQAGATGWRGTLGSAGLTPLAVEIRGEREGGRKSRRWVIWRDALDERDWRRLVRTLRRSGSWRDPSLSP